jgi:hypothetical protein
MRRRRQFFQFSDPQIISAWHGFSRCVSGIENKKPPSLAVFKIRFGDCFCATLPLLYRPGAGVVEAVKKAKAQCKHGAKAVRLI